MVHPCSQYYKFSLMVLFHPIQVFLGHSGAHDVEGNELPRLVYISREKRPDFRNHKKAGAENALYVYIPSITNDSFGNLNISIILEWLELYRLGCLQFSQMLPICSTLTVIIKLIIIRHTCMVYFSWS